MSDARGTLVGKARSDDNASSAASGLKNWSLLIFGGPTSRRQLRATAPSAEGRGKRPSSLPHTTRGSERGKWTGCIPTGFLAFTRTLPGHVLRPGSLLGRRPRQTLPRRFAAREIAGTLLSERSATTLWRKPCFQSR